METLFNSLYIDTIAGKKTYYLGNERIDLIFDSYIFGAYTLIFLYSNNEYIGCINQDTVKPSILDELRKNAKM